MFGSGENMSDKKILDLIKETGATREFTAKEIPQKFINKIIDAGRWGLSVLGVQPWVFIPINDEDILNQIADVLIKRSEHVVGAANVVLRVAAKILKGSKLVIAIYNNKVLEKRAEKFGPAYVERAHIAEIQTIGGAIQNMILQVNEVGLGCVWMDAVTFCEPEIGGILDYDGELIAFLVIGYPLIKHPRSKRQENNVINRFVRIKNERL
jgi:nitroreductase